MSQKRCSHCGNLGHNKRACPNRSAHDIEDQRCEQNFYVERGTRRCSVCDETRHNARKCPVKKDRLASIKAWCCEAREDFARRAERAGFGIGTLLEFNSRWETNPVVGLVVAIDFDRISYKAIWGQERTPGGTKHKTFGRPTECMVVRYYVNGEERNAYTSLPYELYDRTETFKDWTGMEPIRILSGMPNVDYETFRAFHRYPPEWVINFLYEDMFGTRQTRNKINESQRLDRIPFEHRLDPFDRRNPKHPR